MQLPGLLIIFVISASPAWAADKTLLQPMGTPPPVYQGSPSTQLLLSVPATNRAEAAERARVGAGRPDPFAKVTSLKIFPTSRGSDLMPLPKTHMPPPPSFHSGSLVPPPPPGTVSMPGSIMPVGQMPLTETELPEAPEKPQIVNKLKLIGIIGDKAMFKFLDPEARRANKWPAVLVLAAGEQFESMHLISIDNDSIVLEEDGERTTKELERIR